jgi:hypothetical protein
MHRLVASALDVNGTICQRFELLWDLRVESAQNGDDVASCGLIEQGVNSATGGQWHRTRMTDFERAARLWLAVKEPKPPTIAIVLQKGHPWHSSACG